MLSATILNYVSLLTPLKNAWQALGTSSHNIADVALLALILYVLIQFFREARLMPIAVGILTVVALYGIASVLDLPLTRLILRSFFGVFVIVLAIIFQKELRRFFSLLGFWGALRAIVPTRDKTLHIISDTVFKFAKERIGAIIVFQGREFLGRQLEGGHLLRGEVSEALLFSIFDTSSPGHDGAVVIENNKIERFGVHLPLAEKMERVTNFGLRHRAALGLAEISDALIVVVSEEKASINIAWKGELRQVEDEAELHKLLTRFTKAKTPSYGIANVARWVIQHIAILGIATLTAIGIWFFVNSESQFAVVQRNFAVTPEFKNIANEYVMQNFSPATVNVTLEGRSIEFDSLGPENLKLILDLTSVQELGKQQLPISEASVKAPRNFSVIHIDPPILLLNVKKSASSTQ